MHAIRIYIVASHPLYAQGVSSLLEAQPDIQVVGLGQFSPATVREITTLRPDVVVIDSEQGVRGQIADVLLGQVPGLKLVGISLEEDSITITYLQQRSGAAVEDLVTAVRSLPSFTWLPLQRQMRVLVAIQGPNGHRMAKNICESAPEHWSVSNWRAPPLIPPDQESLARLLPRFLPAADLVVGLGESIQMTYLLPEIVARSGARALIVPIENLRWVPDRAVRYLTTAMEETGVTVAFPKPFCSLTMRTYNEASWREEYRDAHISEFARYFGRPEFRILFDSSQCVTRCEVRRDVACGFAHLLADHLIGCSIDQVEQVTSQLLREHDCPNARITDQDYGATLRQVADSIVRDAVRREVEPFLAQSSEPFVESVPVES